MIRVLAETKPPSSQRFCKYMQVYTSFEKATAVHMTRLWLLLVFSNLVSGICSIPCSTLIRFASRRNLWLHRRSRNRIINHVSTSFFVRRVQLEPNVGVSATTMFLPRKIT